MAKKNKKEKVGKKSKFYLADQEKIQKKLEELDSGTFFKPREGKNTIRILPPWSKEGIWYKEATTHYGLVNEAGQDRAYPCLRMYGEACPICEKMNELIKTGGKEDKKLADRIRPRTKYYANILDRKSGKVMIWGFTPKTLGILLSYCADPDYGDISHPEEGFDVVVERTGTGRTDTKYQIRMRPKQTEAGDDWEEKLHDLDAEVNASMTTEELEDIIEMNFGTPKTKKVKKQVAEDEEDDEDDEEEDDEEEEEKPKRKKKGKKQVEEEDDEEDEEED